MTPLMLQIKPHITQHRHRIPQRVLGLLAVVVLTARPVASQCQGPRVGRMAVLGGGFVATEATVLALRHSDWWTTPTRSFYLTHGASASAGQDLLLHGAIAYHVSGLSIAAWRWACVGRAAPWLGAATGFLFGIPKEIGDGFREGKGFAVDDVAAAAIGAILPALHATVPAARIVRLKGNWWPSEEYRARTAGGLPQLENDYAGQRYFLSFVPGRVWPATSLPWLGIAVGHSTATWASAPPVSEWYLTLDLDLRLLPVSGRVWDAITSVGDHVKFPLPGLRVHAGSVRAGLY